MRISFSQRLQQFNEKSSKQQNIPHYHYKIQQNIHYKKFNQQHKDLKNVLNFLQGFNCNKNKSHVRTEQQYQFDHHNITKQKKIKTDKISSRMRKGTKTKENLNASINLGKNNKSKYQMSVQNSKEQYISCEKKGIPNIGNTCYINSILQCLFHLPSFNHNLEKQLSSQKYQHHRSHLPGVIHQYRELYHRVRLNSRTDSISTLPLKQSIASICSLFVDWQQQDAHQFLKHLLDTMHQEINRSSSDNLVKYKILNNLINCNKKIDQIAQEYWEYYRKRDDSYIYDNFLGQLYSMVECSNCFCSSVSFDNFSDLSLPLIKGQNSVQQLLAQFFNGEKLTDYYRCSYCKKYAKKSVKSASLWRIPKHLIIHLKRYQFGNKNNQAIRIPIQCLSLKNFMSQTNDRSARHSSYLLRGMVCHSGGLEKGHYWAVIRDSGRWYSIDDEKVTILSRNQMHQQCEIEGSNSAYILFYSSHSQ